MVDKEKPAKVEVKFLSERDVFDTIRYGVEGALEKASDRPEIKLPKAPQKDTLPFPGKEEKPAVTPLASSGREFYRTMTAAEYRNFANTVAKAPNVTPSPTVSKQLFSPSPNKSKEASLSKASPASFQTPLSPLEKEAPLVQPILPIQEGPPPIAESSPVTKKAAPVAQKITPVIPEATPQAHESEADLLPSAPEPYRMVGEVLNTYIIVEQGKTILLIDKHAAHERILFEKLRSNQEPILSQLLLTPMIFTPEREEGTVLLENEEALSQLGFSLSDYGDGTLAIHSIPSEIPEQEAEATLNVLASQLLAGKPLEPSVLRCSRYGCHAGGVCGEAAQRSEFE